MIRDLLRIIGTGCLLAGGILYFTIDDKHRSNMDTQQMQAQITELQIELATTKKELAIAQTTSSVEADNPTLGKVDGDRTDTVSPDSPLHYVLTIESGSNSTIVAAALERAGMIENATEFDTYLARNGLSGKIQIGDHEIDSSMDYSAIARKITALK